MSILNSFLFPPPPSIFVSAMSMISFTSLTISGLSEIFGRHLRYSKFGDAGGGRSRVFKPISSKAGMLFLYSPAMVYAVAAPFVFDGLVDGIRARLVAAALAIHFAKRVFEEKLLCAEAERRSTSGDE